MALLAHPHGGLFDVIVFDVLFIWWITLGIAALVAFLVGRVAGTAGKDQIDQRIRSLKAYY